MKKYLPTLLLLASAVDAQQITEASRISKMPIIDGDVLNDDAWNDVLEVTSFTQKTPDEGRNASENTVVKVAYTDEMFLVSVICYDSEPGALVISDTRRDSPLNNSDSFSFILDTFKDYQTGYLFGTNPAGIEYDAQITGGGEEVHQWVGESEAADGHGIALRHHRFDVGGGDGRFGRPESDGVDREDRRNAEGWVSEQGRAADFGFGVLLVGVDDLEGDESVAQGHGGGSVPGEGGRRPGGRRGWPARS